MQSIQEYYQRIDLLLTQGRLADAEGLLEDAHNAGGAGPAYYGREQALAQRLGDVPRALAAARKRMESQTDLRVAMGAARFAISKGQISEAERFASDVAVVCGNESLRAALTALLAAARGDAAAADASLRALAAGPDYEVVWRDAVADIRNQLPARSAEAMTPAFERRLNAISAKLPAEEGLRRPLIYDEATADVIESVDTGSEVVAVIFTGLADKATLPIATFDLFLASLGVTAVYLRDFDRLLYWNGVRSLGGVSGTREKLAEWKKGGRRLAFIGSSGGGYGALRWAMEVAADKTICFSAPTNIDSDFLALIGDFRGRIVARRLNDVIPPMERDLARPIRANAGATTSELIFGAANAIDAAHARNIEGLPGVTLRPIEGLADHAVLGPLIERGGFAAMLAKFLDGKEPDSAVDYSAIPSS